MVEQHSFAFHVVKTGPFAVQSRGGVEIPFPVDIGQYGLNQRKLAFVSARSLDTEIDPCAGVSESDRYGISPGAAGVLVVDIEPHQVESFVVGPVIVLAVFESALFDSGYFNPGVVPVCVINDRYAALVHDVVRTVAGENERAGLGPEVRMSAVGPLGVYPDIRLPLVYVPVGFLRVLVVCDRSCGGASRPDRTCLVVGVLVYADEFALSRRVGAGIRYVRARSTSGIIKIGPALPFRSVLIPCQYAETLHIVVCSPLHASGKHFRGYPVDRRQSYLDIGMVVNDQCFRACSEVQSNGDGHRRDDASVNMIYYLHYICHIFLLYHSFWQFSRFRSG